mmetsp:Transcript_50723/g.152764  ORF Transcript_50723/g.152764 Transcript_50723/m.152764 type:complete len:307 (-) Transcript_50723:27-947(-)
MAGSVLGNNVHVAIVGLLLFSCVAYVSLSKSWIDGLQIQNDCANRRGNVSESGVKAFDELVDAAYELAVLGTGMLTVSNAGMSTPKPNPIPGEGGAPSVRRKFNITSYPQELRTTGGLDDSDRSVLGHIYSTADSVFEYGLGESTAIASWVGVPRWSGVDSDAEWVSMARSKSPPHYQFHFGDVGPTKKWGKPTDPTLGKRVLRYAVAPLALEHDPFAVYLVDGRWRVMCACISFLHAMSHGANMSKVQVLIHDYAQLSRGYQVIEKVADRLKMPSANLAVFQLKESTNEDELVAIILKHVNVSIR